MSTLFTPRLRLEPMRPEHLIGLNRLNSDPEVMRYLTGRPETMEETADIIDRVMVRWAEWGCSWWSLIELDSDDLIGAGCVQYLDKDPTNPHEIGWRLRTDRWGRGLASEAAQRMARFAFEDLHVPLLRAVCQLENTASARVMQRLGMQYCGIEHWYRMDCHAYEMTAAQWQSLQSTAPAHATPSR